MEKVLIEASGESPLETIRLKQMYLTDFFVWLSFMYEKSDVDSEEEKFQDALRKAKRGR